MPYKPFLPECPPILFAEQVKRHLSFDPKSARRIQAVQKQRRAPRPKKESTVSGIIVNPKHLLPIHLRSTPLRPLSPTTEQFAVYFGTRNIAKRRLQDWEKHTPVFENQIRRLPRKKSRFFENSAIEVDSEGEDIPSTTTTPSHTPLTTPPPTPPTSSGRGWGIIKLIETQSKKKSQEVSSLPPNSAQPSFSVRKSEVKKSVVDSSCLLCGILTSGPFN